MTDEQLLTPEQIAEGAQLNVVTVRRLLRAGTIPAYKVAGQWRVEPADYRAWLESSRHRVPAGVMRPRERPRKHPKSRWHLTTIGGDEPQTNPNEGPN